MKMALVRMGLNAGRAPGPAASKESQHSSRIRRDDHEGRFTKALKPQQECWFFPKQHKVDSGIAASNSQTQ